MKKWHILCIVVAMLLLASGCSVDSVETEPSVNIEIAHPTEVQPETTVPTLDSIEYWKIVREEIISMLNKYNLYVSHIDSGYPCVQFFVEPGVMTAEGEIVAAGLSHEQYEELYQCVKEELHTILDQYKLNKPKTAFHACDSIVGIFFYNWFVDEQKVYDRVDSLQVASYQLDLLEYYHDYEEDTYLRMQGFSVDPWSKYAVYTP